MRLLRWALVLGILLLVFGGWRSLAPASPGAAPRLYRLQHGSTLTSVAAELEELGIVRNAAAFAWWARLNGRAGSLRAGRYELTGAWSGRRILTALVDGDTFPVRLTFPEGIWMSEVIALAADSLDVSAAALTEAVHDEAVLEDLGIDGPSAEGYLFPSTYDFEGSERARQVVARLVTALEERWDARRRDRAQELGLTRHEVLTLASIIEAETARPEERALVSAVYHRRLQTNMMLQADPTVVFAIGERGRAPRLRDLDHASPYNTYRRRGLPPGPIGNPGLAAIDAALWPDASCSALFFVARPDGSHVFSDTYDQHLAARRQLRAQ